MDPYSRHHHHAGQPEQPQLQEQADQTGPQPSSTSSASWDNGRPDYSQPPLTGTQYPPFQSIMPYQPPLYRGYHHTSGYDGQGPLEGGQLDHRRGAHYAAPGSFPDQLDEYAPPLSAGYPPADQHLAHAQASDYVSSASYRHPPQDPRSYSRPATGSYPLAASSDYEDVAQEHAPTSLLPQYQNSAPSSAPGSAIYPTFDQTRVPDGTSHAPSVDTGSWPVPSTANTYDAPFRSLPPASPVHGIRVKTQAGPSAAASDSALAPLPATSTDAHDQEGGAAPAKQDPPRQRKTIAQSACELCRRKRTKCVVELGFTECTTCRNQQVECIFSGVDKRKESVRDLRVRIRKLEDLLAAVQNSQSAEERDHLVRGIVVGLRSIDEIEAVAPAALAQRQISRSDRSVPSVFYDGAAAAAAAANGLTKQTSRSSDLAPDLPNDVLSKHRESTSVSKRARAALTNSSPSADDLMSSDDDRPAGITAPASQQGIVDHGQWPGSVKQIVSDGAMGTDEDEDELLEATMSALTDRLTISDNGSLRAISAVSNLAFAAAIKSDRTKGSEKRSLNSADDQGSRSDFEDVHRVELGPNVTVPPGTSVETVRHLLTRYFTWDLPQHPVLSRPAFLEHMRTGGQYFSSLLLNAILAWSAMLSDLREAREDPDDPYSAGAKFARLSEQMLRDQVDSSGGSPYLPITTVQALALMATRCYATGHELKAWLHMGSCARMALDSGLHLDARAYSQTEANGNGLTPDDLYVRSRAFYGVWYVEQEFCSLLGRTGVIRDIVVTCPPFETLNTPWSRSEDFDWWASVRSGAIVPLNAPPPPAENYSVLWPLARQLIDSFVRSMRIIYYRVASGSPYATREERKKALDQVMKRTRKVMAALPPAPLLDEHRQGEQAGRGPCAMLLHLHLLAHSHVILLNRPFMGYFDGDEADDSPRHRCISSALSILSLMRQWQQCWSGGLQTASNGNTHMLISAATVFLYELSAGTSTSQSPGSSASAAIQSPRTSAELELRRRTARERLELDILPFLRAMGQYRPGPRDYMHKISEAIRELQNDAGQRQFPAKKQRSQNAENAGILDGQAPLPLGHETGMHPSRGHSWSTGVLVPDQSQYAHSLFSTGSGPWNSTPGNLPGPPIWQDLQGLPASAPQALDEAVLKGQEWPAPRPYWYMQTTCDNLGAGEPEAYSNSTTPGEPHGHAP